MEPVAPIQVGMSGGASSAQPVVDGSRGSAEAGLGTRQIGVGSSGIAGASTGISRVYSGVSQLLQSIGGGAEDNKLLQLLIAAMILLALLTDQKDSGESMSQALSGLGGQGANRSQYIGMFTSSTTITIQQSSTTIVSADMTNALGSAGGATQSGGAEVDFSV